jgi:hypothetical protein
MMMVMTRARARVSQVVELYFICGKSKQELSWYKKHVRSNRHDLYSLVEFIFICEKSRQELSWYKKHVRSNRDDIYSL